MSLATGGPDGRGRRAARAGLAAPARSIAADGSAGLRELAAAIDDRSAHGIAAAVGRLISGGTLPRGTRLPTVRDLARALGTSPTTVSEAWQTLARAGAMETDGRRGSFVLGRAAPSGPRRYRRIGEHAAAFRADLSAGTPDPALLPDPRPVLAAVSRTVPTTSYLDASVLPELEARLRATWPFVPEALTVVDGAMDALDRIASVLVRHGDRVLVEAATFPPVLDLLEQLGAEPVGLALDDDGIVPAALADALAMRPVALILQPRAHNPTGISMTSERAGELAALLTQADANHRGQNGARQHGAGANGAGLVVVEDDHAGDIAVSPLASLGAHLPGRTVHVRSFSKSHGPDLRLAAIGGAASVVDRVVERRLLGPAWSSRLLQSVLLAMLDDEATIAAVQRARDTYAERRRKLCDALDARGVRYTGRDGINLWIEVADERAALMTLAAHGIAVAPGTPFLVRDGGVGPDRIRLTVGQVADSIGELADAVAQATKPASARPGG